MHDDLSLHNEHRKWIRQLDFYENEIDFFFNELDRVFDKNIAVVTTVGHSKEYTDILNKKKKKIDKLRSKIIQHENNIREEIEEENKEAHIEVEKKIELFILGFEKMKKNFRRFASRND